MRTGNLVTHQSAKTLIRPALLFVEPIEMRRRAAKACQVFLRQVDAPGREIAADIAQDVCQLHTDAQALRGLQRLSRGSAEHMSHSQAHCSRNTIAVAVQCAEIAHLLWPQVRGYPIEKIEKDRYGNGVCVQNGGKPGAMWLAGRGKREARREPIFPAIQFSTNILRVTAIRRFIHHIVQNAKKGIERGNLMSMLRAEKARSKMKCSSMRRQKPFIPVCCSGDETV